MDTLALLHAALVDAMIADRPYALDQPVTVAEIYQDLVPYRSVRTTVGFALNADYEHALLHLLAGERGLARIDPPEVQDALRQEVKQPNPNVGVFRNYATCDVFVTMAAESPANTPAPKSAPVASSTAAPRAPAAPAAPPPAAPATPAPAAPLAAASADPKRIQDALSGAATPDARFAPPPVPPVRAATEQKPAPRAAAPPAPGSPPPKQKRAPDAPQPVPAAAQGGTRPNPMCIGCLKPLPPRSDVKFCPYCGRDQAQRACGRCGELMESGWRFCIRCGAS